MRVLLVQAFTALDMELVYPLGLAYLASHLDGHEVTLFDLNLHRAEPYRALAREVARLRPDVIGFSLRNMKVGRPDLHTDDFGPQQEAIRAARQAAPHARVVLGGTAFSLYAEAMMARLPEADFGVWGEAEHRFPALLQDLDRPERVPGVYYRRDGAVRFTGMPPAEDWSGLRRPRRDLLPMAPYAASSPVSVGVQAKRGCGLRCIHCSDTYLSGNRVRLRDPGDVVDEIAALVHDHGVRRFFFCDQIFNIPVGHAIAICEEITRRGLDVRWSAWFNEHRNTLPDALIVALKRAGCGLLSFSPDHVDDRMLRSLDKNFTHADMLHTVQVAKRHDMDVEYSFFLNAPGEDLRSLGAILRFLAHARLELGPRLRLFSLLMMQPIRIYPHTRLQQLAVAQGLLDADHPLIEGQFWNPGALRWAVAGIQAGAGGLYRARAAWNRLQGGEAAEGRA